MRVYTKVIVSNAKFCIQVCSDAGMSTCKWFFNYTGQQKKCPFQLLTNPGPEWCAEHDGVFRFSNFVLVFTKVYIEISKITLFRHIATIVTPFIYFNLHKYHITNVYHK